ncbi:porin [Ideonella sp. B508-1]|uniref:porin n=1 Tax=Ideonella sp. B508-1 TaxID=137716 RepID=UPI00034ACF41|nr:porin [Ideonella sp. B508-1]
MKTSFPLRTLAAIGLLTPLLGLAQSASNVSIFGTVDVGYRWSGDNVDPSRKHDSAIDSGLSTPSRLGFQGHEDLGQGLQAGFLIESGIGADTGTVAGGGFWSRQAYVSLAQRQLGTLSLGRQYTPGYLFESTVDPFGSVTVGQYNNVYLTEYRWDNQVAYVSPAIQGVTVAASLASNGYGQEAQGHNVRVASLLPQYQNGPLFVGLHLQQLHSSLTGATHGKNVNVWDVGGTYDFGVLKLAALVGGRQASAGDFSPDTGATEAERTRQWLLGATVPLSAADALRVSYAHRASRPLDGGEQAVAGQWALGLEHALSKRTAVYAVFADVQNNAAAKASTTLASFVGAGYNAGNGYQRGFGAGLRHNF